VRVKNPNLARGVFVIGADQREWRMIEVVDRRAFTKKFRVYGDGEIAACPSARRLLKSGNRGLGDGAGKHSAADNNRVMSALDAERFPDLLTRGFDERQIEASIVIAGSAHAHERDF